MDLTDEQIRGLSHQELLSHFLQTREEFNEFQTSSSEIEKMMDAELEELKAHLKKCETRIQQLTTEQSRSKDRNDESRQQWAQVEEQLRRENAQLREANENLRERVRKLEQRNDVLETSERNKEFLASDLGNKLDNAIEKIAMLENELYERQVAADDMYRLRTEEMRSAERPRLIVEPLRNETSDGCEETPDEPSPGTSKQNITMNDLHDDDVCMEEPECEEMELTTARMEDVHIDNNKNIRVENGLEKNRRVSGAGACVNRIVKDLMSKVERLETLLATIRVSSTSSAAGHQLTSTRA